MTDSNDYYVKLVSSVMEDMMKVHKCQKHQIGLTVHNSGIITLDVFGVPIEHFFDGRDLVTWAENYEYKAN